MKSDLERYKAFRATAKELRSRMDDEARDAWGTGDPCLDAYSEIMQAASNSMIRALRVLNHAIAREEQP